MTDGKAKTTHAGRLIRAALFAVLAGRLTKLNSPPEHVAEQRATTRGPERTTLQRRRSQRASPDVEREAAIHVVRLEQNRPTPSPFILRP